MICYTAMKLSGDDLQRVFTVALPDDVITKLAKATGLQQRERKLEVVRFIRSMVIAAATGYGGRQADILRLYVENENERAWATYRALGMAPAGYSVFEELWLDRPGTDERAS